MVRLFLNSFLFYFSLKAMNLLMIIFNKKFENFTNLRIFLVIQYTVDIEFR